jgi:hypothetical protein
MEGILFTHIVLEVSQIESIYAAKRKNRNLHTCTYL